eukprot:11251615-Alexandrium_andersonii.AAC.1
MGTPQQPVKADLPRGASRPPSRPQEPGPRNPQASTTPAEEGTCPKEALIALLFLWPLAQPASPSAFGLK